MPSLFNFTLMELNGMGFSIKECNEQKRKMQVSTVLPFYSILKLIYIYIVHLPKIILNISLDDFKDHLIFITFSRKLINMELVTK